MAKVHIVCPGCGQSFECGEKNRGNKIKCAQCKHVILVPLLTRTETAKRWRAKWMFRFGISGLFLLMVIGVLALYIYQPVIIHWPDRRPIGALFLASNSSSSPTNPRGWFNDPKLDFTGTNGAQRFKKALFEYTDRSIDILKRTSAQGVIVWDLEGEQYPHKTTFIGDPRLLNRMAPEMAPLADELFGRLRNAGFKVGLTVRPQQLVFRPGWTEQSQVINIKKALLGKIDFARTNWGATLFYIDSNWGLRRPDEMWQLRSLAKERPDILLIPEHTYLPYWAFSAPYNHLSKDPAATASQARKLYHNTFQVMDIDDAASADKIMAAWYQGDILVFRAWFWSPECALLERLAREKK
ncbi:MAG: hypothetical protein WDM80_02925 [Limisphaerales bacterium]